MVERTHFQETSLSGFVTATKKKAVRRRPGEVNRFEKRSTIVGDAREFSRQRRQRIQQRTAELQQKRLSSSTLTEAEDGDDEIARMEMAAAVPAAPVVSKNHRIILAVHKQKQVMDGGGTMLKNVSCIPVKYDV